MQTSYTAQRAGVGRAAILPRRLTPRSWAASTPSRMAMPGKEHKLLQPAGQAQLPIIAEHRMAAIEQDAFEDGRRIAQAAGPEYHKQSSQNAERAQHPQCVTQFAAAAVQQVVFHRLADAMQAAPDEVRQPCAVPQSADKEGQNQVAVLFCGAAPAASQRDIDVIPAAIGTG